MQIGSLEDQKFPKNAKMGIFGRQGDTYAVVGQPSNLVIECNLRFTQPIVFEKNNTINGSYIH
jgi:hypothetical protein